MKALRIDLGCGDSPIEGFDGLDVRPLPGVKYVSDVRQLPFKDGTVDELAARHVIEHFTRQEAAEVLREWRRVLKPGAPITIWCPNLLYIAEEYLKLPDIDKNPERKYHLLGWLYGEQNYDTNFHYFAYDWWLLGEMLIKTGFAKVDSLHDLHAQNLCVRAYNATSVQKAAPTLRHTLAPKVLVESTARVFGDSLLSYPLTAIFKAKYPGAVVSYAAGKIERPLFDIASTIDEVTEKTIDNPAVPLNDGKYDMILRGAFDVDEKWKPRRFIDGFDGPDGWDKVIDSGNLLSFNYPEGDLKRLRDVLARSEGKKRVMMFIPTPRPNMSIPWEISGWDIANYQRVVELLNSERRDLEFFAFYGHQETSHDAIRGPNVTQLGRLAAYEEVLWFSHIDMLISTSTSVSGMIAPLVETPQVVIHTCEEDSSPVWSGIPDKCVLPQLRFLYLCSHKTTGEVISFVKPEAGGRIYEWEFNHFWKRSVVKRRMRESHDVKPEAVAEEVLRRLSNPDSPGKEWTLPEGRSICESCRLKQELDICIYDFKPRLRNGLWMGENRGSVRTAAPQSTAEMMNRLSQADKQLNVTGISVEEPQGDQYG